MIKKINEYLEYNKIVNENKGNQNYEQIIAKYLTDFYEINNQLNDTKDLVLFYKTTTKLSNRSINKCIKLLRLIHKHHNIENDDLFKFKLLKEKYVEKEIIPMTDLKKIFKYINSMQDRGNAQKYKMLTYILYDTGLRPRELRLLKTANVDIKNKSIYVTETKTGKPRYVFMSKQVTKRLAKYIENHDNEYLFWNDLKNRTFTQSDLKNFWKRVKNATGIKSLNSYKFRHTYITDLVDLEIPPAVTQYQAGHERITTTMIYYHASTKNQKKHLEKIDREINIDK